MNTQSAEVSFVSTAQPGFDLSGIVSRRSMTFAEFLQWEPETGHTEWIEGVGVQYMSVTKHHQAIVQLLVVLLTVYVNIRRLGQILTAPYAMCAKPNGNAREPDLFFVSQERLHLIRESYLEGPADLVIEVISDESVTRDRVEKFDEYQEAGISEYWIIDPRPGRQRAMFFVLKEGQFLPIKLDANGIYHSSVLPGLKLNVVWLWEEFPDIQQLLKEIAN
jgi:Uma2 family endonuclease